MNCLMHWENTVRIQERINMRSEDELEKPHLVLFVFLTALSNKELYRRMLQVSSIQTSVPVNPLVHF